ncbi:MAG: hypothetical protein K6F80_04765, partial [Oscillospiraceae bacterium]|nr:hypothetical protein [Oscillospiraceae bacterium]
SANAPVPSVSFLDISPPRGKSTPNPLGISRQPARNERGWSLIQSRGMIPLHPHRFFILTAISTNAVSGIFHDTAFVFGMKKGKQPHPTKDNGCDIKYNLSDGT